MLSDEECLIAVLLLAMDQAETSLMLCSLRCTLHIAIAWRLPSWQTSSPPPSRQHRTARQDPPPRSGQAGRRAVPLRRLPGVQQGTPQKHTPDSQKATPGSAEHLQITQPDRQTALASRSADQSMSAPSQEEPAIKSGADPHSTLQDSLTC